MGGIVLWLFLLIVAYLRDGDIGFRFWLVLWGGVALLFLGVLYLAFGNGKESLRTNNKTYIYLSVYFQNRGNWYYYLTDDPTIRPNDVVVVPWGKYNSKELAIVGWVEHRKAADVPYPLNRMKYIIRKAPDNCRYAFDEMVKWPMEVDVASRWTSDRYGNGIHVVNNELERAKLTSWIRKNPRLIPVKRMTEDDMANLRAMALSNW